LTERGLYVLASPTGFEPVQSDDSEDSELVQEDRCVAGPDLTDDHCT
jgi:hypothetical protein